MMVVKNLLRRSLYIVTMFIITLVFVNILRPLVEDTKYHGGSIFDKVAIVGLLISGYLFLAPMVGRLILRKRKSDTLFGKIANDNPWVVGLGFVLIHILTRGYLEKEYGINNGLIGTWVKKYLEEGEDALEPHNGNPYAALHTSKSLSEVERLRLIVAKQEVEIARLKKGYWVEGAGANKEYVTGSGKTTKSLKNSE